MNCPSCGKKIDLRIARAEGEWREIIGLLPTFGRHGKLVFEYVEKFGVNPLRIKTAKLLRLFEDVAKLFRGAKFVYRKREYSISVEGIVEALEICCNKNFEEPIENHNYLKKVMIGIAEKERTENRDRLDREQRKREETGPAKYVGSKKDEKPDTMTAAEWKRKKGVDALAGKIGNAD